MAMAKRPMNLGQALKDYVKGGTPLPAAYKNYQKYADMQKQKFGPVTPRPAPPSGGAAAPVSGMGGAGGTQQMIKKGGMTYSMGGMTPPKKPVTLQTRQFGTGPGMRPTPKHIGKAITDRGKAILGKADGGMLKGSGRDGCAIRGKTRA